MPLTEGSGRKGLGAGWRRGCLPGLPCHFPQRVMPASQRVSAYVLELTWLSCWGRDKGVSVPATPHLAAGTEASVEQAGLGKLTPAGPQSQLRWDHSLRQQHLVKDGWTGSSTLIPRTKAPSHLLGLGCVPEALPLPSALTLGPGQEQTSWAGVCI